MGVGKAHIKNSTFLTKNRVKTTPAGATGSPRPGGGWRSCLKYSITFKQLRRIVASRMNTDETAHKFCLRDNLTASHLVMI